MLCAELGITQDVRADHAQWLELMKEDSKAMFTAAAKAGQAVDYLESLQSPEPHPSPRLVPDPEPERPVALDRTIAALRQAKAST